MKRLMYAIPLSAIAMLVFAAIAVAQDVPQGQEQSPITTDTNTTSVQNSTTVPAKENPAETATTPAESATPAPSALTTVDISDRAFNPAQLNITPGTTVRFVNSDTEAHTATADNDLFDTGELEPGESLEIYFEGTGSVTYHCELHPDMKGSIVVGEAPNSEPSSEADEQDTEAAKPSRGY
jgi:plastocyanin